MPNALTTLLKLTLIAHRHRVAARAARADYARTLAAGDREELRLMAARIARRDRIARRSDRAAERAATYVPSIAGVRS